MENKSAFEASLEYILNSSTAREIDVFEAAVEKRKNRLSNGLMLNGEEAGKQMAENINKTIMASVSTMTDTIRKFSADLIAKEAPNLSSEQAEALLNSWIPEDISYNGDVKPITKGDKINGIPKSVMLDMTHQFVSYGIGKMSDAENKGLRDAMGDWSAKYWERFPVKLQKAIKDFINGEIASDEFWKTVKGLLS
ncbi:MAG: hypothetical protein CR988_07520 [Treponema sp.]|nr:MAG: hypothetical protein CR988_07520 [Treponema sp.]